MLIFCGGPPIATHPRATDSLRFDGYELDVRAGELRKHGVRLRLRGQPLQVLEILLERAGDVVTREELQTRIWAADTFVDFDHSLHNAIARIREVLGDSAETPRYIETLPRCGYRYIGPVDGFQTLRLVAETGDPATQPVSLVAPAKRMNSLFFAVCAVVTLGLLAWIARQYVRANAAVPPIRSIAVLPLNNLSGDPSEEFFVDGMTDQLITDLAKIGSLRVISRTSIMQYKGARKSLPQIARELNVDAVIEGSVVRAGDRVRIATQLIYAATDQHLWAESYERDFRDILTLQGEIAQQVANQVRIVLTPAEKERLGIARPVDREAHEFYLKGRYSWNKRTPSDVTAAISYFNQAIAKDPGYALAYSGLADAYLVLTADGGGTLGEGPAKSDAAARKALELDPTLAHPHAVLAGNAMNRWDFAEGEAEFKKTFELDPNDATAHQWYALNLGMIGGREQEALAEAKRAQQLDPLSPVTTFNVGDIYNLSRKYDEGIATCRKLANQNPTFAVAHFCLAYAYWGKRMYPQSIEEWKTYGQLSRNKNELEFASAMEKGFRSAGWKGALENGIEDLQVQRKNGYYSPNVSPFMIASLYADLGDKQRAFRWLNTADQDRDRMMICLRTYFQLDPLHPDPRFAELVRRVGLPQ